MMKWLQEQHAQSPTEKGAPAMAEPSPRPWSYRNTPDNGAMGRRDWIEDANGNVVVSSVGHMDGPLICLAVNSLRLGKQD
jgi:hypothetical protein